MLLAFLPINSAMSSGPTPLPVVNVWSEPANGLSGRLRVELEDLKPGLRHAVYLVLRNHSPDPVAVTNQPEIRAALFDLAGTSVTTAGISTRAPVHKPQWAVI